MSWGWHAVRYDCIVVDAAAAATLFDYAKSFPYHLLVSCHLHLLVHTQRYYLSAAVPLVKMARRIMTRPPVPVVAKGDSCYYYVYIIAVCIVSRDACLPMKRRQLSKKMSFV